MRDEILTGDCLVELDKVPDGSVELVYVDPPFFTQKTHALKTRDRKKQYSFSDVWDSRAEYLAFLRARIAKCIAKLRPSGSLFFHCDTSASHHIRCLLDDLCGEEMFRSEIIWSYKRWANSQRSPLPSHQTIFFYSKTHDYQYHQVFEAYSPSTNVEQILQRRQRDAHGKSVYERDDNGDVVLDGGKRGVPVGDVWDIPLLNPKARERVGYPTQKPVLLLERIIELVTSPNDVVLDPFCGSGTALVAAKLLGRHFIGIDSQPEAVALASRRVRDPVRTSSELMRKGRDSYEQADKDALSFLHELGAVPVQRNKGIDAVIPTSPGTRPVLVRVQRRAESVLSAAEQLVAAGASKQPAVLILVVTDDHRPAGLFDELPRGVHRVSSVGVEVRRVLKAAGVTIEAPASSETGTGSTGGNRIVPARESGGRTGGRLGSNQRGSKTATRI
jgi:site-specific DNA-methyltransferase (adenine-specific)